MMGDISSEKAYLKSVLLTCAKDTRTVVEVHVKGFIISNGKWGLRGKVQLIVKAI